MLQYEKYMKSLPVIPSVAVKVLSIAEDKIEISFKELQDTIKIDPGLTTKILKVANSALYARQKEIASLQTAISLLGFKNIKSLVLLVSASSTFKQQAGGEFYRFFWKHSIITAFTAKDITIRCGNKDRAEDAFLAGLLHNIGQVALHGSDPGLYETILSSAIETQGRISDLEQHAFGTTHRDVGGEILKSWSFPDIYVDAAREHALDNITSPHKQLIIYVSLADFIISNLDMYAEKPMPLEVMGRLIPYTSLSENDIEYYHTDFQTSLADDPLFIEATSLFKV